MKTNTQISRFNATGLKVRTAVKGGKLTSNHTRAGLNVRTAVKSGRIAANYCRRALALDGTAL